MRKAFSPAWILAVTAPLALGGCGLGAAMGFTKSTPDEFEVVTKAPLVIPPDFALHPPAPGQNSGPQTEADLIAQKAIVGDTQTFTAGMSAGERALVSKAGASHADPLIRQVVDQEYGKLVRRGDDYSNRLIFWDTAQAGAPSSPDKVEGQGPATIKK